MNETLVPNQQPANQQTPNTLRQLPALEQIRLALEYRGYRVKTQAKALLIDLPLSQLRLSYLDCDGSQNQLLEVLLPLELVPDDQQFRELAPTLAVLDRAFGGLSVVSGAEGLSLRSCVLHPRQLPDLRYVLSLVHGLIQAWSCSYSLISPYLKGQVSISGLQQGLPR
jgi:hypothetical protein